MKIPFHKPHITQKELDSVATVIQSGWLTMGPKTIEFEKEFTKTIKTTFSISVNSATAALHLALNALGIGENDEVIIPTNTFISTAEAILYTGAKPILCDIEEKNHNIAAGPAWWASRGEKVIKIWLQPCLGGQQKKNNQNMDAGPAWCASGINKNI